MESNNSTHHCGQIPQNLVATVLPPVLIIELLLGLPGNLMALYVFCHRLGHWRPTILFLFNLVLADFLLLVSLPFRIDNLIRGEHWVFGDVWCRINLFMLAVNRSASIAFMTAVAVDRYFKIVHPHHKVNSMNLHQAAGIVFFIWAVVIALRLPLLSTKLLSITEVSGKNISICRSFSSYKNPSLAMQIHYKLFVIEFFLPLLLLIFCSIRITCILQRRQMDKERKVRRAIRTVMVIVGVFIICFFPGIATGLTAMQLKEMGTKYCNAYILTSQLFSLSIGFTYLNSALDPVIYLFSSSMFRNTVKKTINRTGIVHLNLSRRGSTTSASDAD